MFWDKKSFIDGLVDKAVFANKNSKKTIVFPETDEVILRACSIIEKKGIATPLILGRSEPIKDLFKKYNITNLTDKNIFDYLDVSNAKQLEDYSKEFLAMRKKDGKTVVIDEARKLMEKPHYYGAMLVHHGIADGMITGINSATKPYYPAFQIIKTKEGVEKASGLMITEDPKTGRLFFFADVALNIDPTSEELAGIALSSAETVINFGIKPKIAMLSFSTKDSAKHKMVDKVKNATRIVKQKNSGLDIDGELQVDAAIIPEVAKKKAPNSVLEGNANVLIFPDLNSGNIGYKLVQRLAGFKAVGPIVQGLNKPVNDLSRGASVQDVVELAAITVLQSL